MPTQVQPDDPNATGAARLQAMVGGREPGTPSIAGKPGAQPGRTSFPAPPAAATAPPGRPAQPSPKPGTPAAGAVPPSAAPPQAAAPPPTPGSPQPAPAAGSSETAGVGAPAAPAPPSLDARGGMATQTFTSPTIPPAGVVGQGAQVQTPFGTVSDSPTGQRLALDQAGQQKYKETLAALRGRFQLPRVMKGMQGLPEMELKLGVSNYDPFTGRYHGRE